jgi:hypothetical protein
MYEADMHAETYPDRWQAWAESLEPDLESDGVTSQEREAPSRDAIITVAAAEAEAHPHAEIGGFGPPSRRRKHPP